MKSNFQQFIDMLDNADINYNTRFYNEAGAMCVYFGSTEFYFTLDGELADIKS